MSLLHRVHSTSFMFGFPLWKSEKPRRTLYEKGGKIWKKNPTWSRKMNNFYSKEKLFFHIYFFPLLTVLLKSFSFSFIQSQKSCIICTSRVYIFMSFFSPLFCVRISGFFFRVLESIKLIEMAQKISDNMFLMFLRFCRHK